MSVCVYLRERERERMLGRCRGRHGERGSRGRGEAGRRIEEWGWSEGEKDRVRIERGRGEKMRGFRRRGVGGRGREGEGGGEREGDEGEIEGERES